MAGWRDTGSPQRLHDSRLQPWLHMGATGRALELARHRPITLSGAWHPGANIPVKLPGGPRVQPGREHWPT